MNKRINSFLIAFGTAVLLSSCTNILEDQIVSSNNLEALTTKTLVVDTCNIENPISIEETEEFKALKEILKQKAAAYNYEYDENFSSNIWAIRELPITIYARGQGNTSNRYFSCEGKNKEVKLVGSATSLREKFFLKILPSSSGIPYLIYSKAAGTALSVGYYNSNPNNKILFSKPDDTGSLYSADWDLLPSSSAKGYFAIESQSYLGQSDPNNMWSVFNYVVEVKNDNKIGYSQYTKKAQQEFLIKADDNFRLEDLTFDANSAIITAAPDIKIVSTDRNESIETASFRILVSKDNEKERSFFSEKQGNLLFNISNATRTYQRPTVIANRFVLPETGTPSDAKYKTSGNQEINKPINFKIEGTAPGNCLIEVSSYMKTYNVSVNYKVNAYYNDRKIILTGTWRGYVIADPTLTKPTHATRFFDLDSGQEIRNFTSANVRIIM